VLLDALWKTLENGKWKTLAALKEATGVDSRVIDATVSFLSRWDFIEIERSPELQIRRKPDTISPTETLNLLQELAHEPTTQTLEHTLAERVACRVCNGHNLLPAGRNLVECEGCHEKQWATLEGPRGELGAEAEIDSKRDPGFVARILLRLGHPQKAYETNIPRTTQYFWFRCTNCGTTSTDYPHGHARYLTCSQCQTHNHFW